MLAPLKKSYDKPRHCIKKQRHGFAYKGLYSQSYVFSSSHIQMWELDHKEGWAPKNWCFQTVVLEKTLESPLDSKEIKPFNLKGNQPWIFIGSTYDEAEAPILRHLMRKANSLEKTLMLEKIESKRRGWQRWDGWMASPTWLTRVWASSGSWWWIGKPGVLQSMGSQRAVHDLETEQQQIEFQFCKMKRVLETGCTTKWIYLTLLICMF